jgi:hypothetical protein
MKWLDNWILKRAKYLRNRDDAIVSIDRAERGIIQSTKDDRPSIGSNKHRMNFHCVSCQWWHDGRIQQI